MIFCCQCGTLIEPNPVNMCIGCIRKTVDISKDIQKQAILQFCKGCQRYLQPPNEWIHCSLESRELLSLCLKKLKGLAKVKLVDAAFIWTEPHSKRIKVKLTIQDEVYGCLTLQQIFCVEYTVQGQMCNDCHRTEAKDYWKAKVQVRQKGENKKTFYNLEQLILKHNAHEHTVGIKTIHEGIDFMYATENMAKKMVDFLLSVLPCRYDHSKKLISHDTHSNTYNYKFTYTVEIVPLSKDSVICLPKKLASKLGAIAQLCIINRVNNVVHLIDPSSAQTAELNSVQYWKTPFISIFNPTQLVEYIVMDICEMQDEDRKIFPGQGPLSNRHVLADVWVVLADDLGQDNATIHTRTHLGHLLKCGDSVLGYNVKESNVNDEHFDNLNKELVPDVILVKKIFADKAEN